MARPPLKAGSNIGHSRRYNSGHGAGGTAASRKKSSDALRIHARPFRPEAVLRDIAEGLADDGGLYVPETYPRVDPATLESWRGLSYPSLAFEVLSLYVSDIPPADLKAICEKTYTPEIFGSSDIAPLRKLDTGLYLQQLSNGPTLAFKDMAMQLLGNLIEYELARRHEELNILGRQVGTPAALQNTQCAGRKG